MVSGRGGIDRAFLEFHYLPDTRLSLLYLIICIDALEHNFYLSTTYICSASSLTYILYLFRLGRVCMLVHKIGEVL